VVLDSKELGLVYEINPGILRRPRILIIADTKGNEIEAVPYDLAEKNDDGSYQKTIVKTLDAGKWNINVAEYLL